MKKKTFLYTWVGKSMIGEWNLMGQRSISNHLFNYQLEVKLLHSKNPYNWMGHGSYLSLDGVKESFFSWKETNQISNLNAHFFSIADILTSQVNVFLLPTQGENKNAWILISGILSWKPFLCIHLGQKTHCAGQVLWKNIKNAMEKFSRALFSKHRNTIQHWYWYANISSCFLFLYLVF